ncbi:glycosyltransferase [Streptomyces axinellae]|uniref:Glycosyltransferase family 2 protein n=1 Tax=Streptomyces axinellae TaxID=552788 RepID=A0ABP6CIA3_9ACTN
MPFPERGAAFAADRPVPDGATALPPGAVSIVVPTFNEAGNVGELLHRVSASVPARLPCEVIFVDDSMDDTPEAVRASAVYCPYPVQVRHRDAPVGGLGGAVVEGLRLARGEWIVVMDGDLQHPPELVPDLVGEGVRGGAEVVVASRYRRGGSRAGLAGGYRVAVSRASTWLAKTLFPRRLRGISDPMSGFFAVRRAGVEGVGLHPLGYKVLLELMVRCRPVRVAEAPFTFAERYAGESKSSLPEGLRFLRHLAGLRTVHPAAQLAAFALIGLTGFVPNLAALRLLTGAGAPYLPAEVVANQFGVAWNSLLVEALLFRERRHHRPWADRTVRFALLANADLAVRIPLIALLVQRLGLAVLPATALALAITCTARFAATELLIHLPGKRRVPTRSDAQAHPAMVPGGVR